MRKIISALLVLLTVMSTLLCLAVPVSAESLYIRKIVSVVYDDSGSMSGDKSENANYAMQTFCGLLNSEDTLYVTRMSGGGAQRVNLSAGEIENSLKKIRSYTHTGGTPYEAVRTAFNTLKDEKEQTPNPNTQYWLVVITDGAFAEEADPDNPGNGIKYDQEQLNKNFQGYVNTLMPNETFPRATFLAIGSGLTTPTNEALGGSGPDVKPDSEDYDQRLFVAEDSSKIVKAMSDLADKISGRKRADTIEVQADGATVRVSSEIPLMNIAVLNQGSEAVIGNARYTGGKEDSIVVDREALLTCPKNEKSNKVVYKDLNGHAYLLKDAEHKEGVIRAGTYDITFSGEVDKSKLVILFEPALELRMKFSVNGKEVADISGETLHAGDKISASYAVYEMGTDTIIGSEKFPPGTQYELLVSEDGKEMKKLSGNGAELKDYELKDKKTRITARVLIQGFRPIEYSEEFTPKVKIVRYEVKAAFRDDKVQEVKLDEIGKNDQLALVFTVLADGVPVTDPAAVKALNPTVSLDLAGNSGEMKVESDGRIVYTPNAAAAPADKQDEFKVTATCKLQGGESASLGYTVKVAEYELKAEYLDKTVQNVSFDSIQSNKALALVFTVLKNGTPLTDPAAVKALNPVITVDLAGNSGETKVESDGRIVYTPNAATAPAGKSDEFTVNVKCTLENTAAKKEASLPYKVLMAKFEVFAVNGTGPVKKTELFGNKQSVSFYVKKDNRRLTGDELKPYEGAGYFTLDGAQSKLKLSVSASGGTGDGILTVTPYSEEEYQLNFFSWWSNWYHYWFELSGEDVKVSFNPFGTATAVLDVTEEGFVYQAFCVYLPLLLELAILYVIVSYTYCVLAKPKFGKSAVIYSGRVFFDPYTNTHEITGMSRTSLVRFNKLKYRLAYTTKSKTVTAGGIRVSAGKGGRVECYERGPSFKGNISFVHNSTLQLPSEILKYCREFGVNFSIAPFSPIATIDKSSVGTLTPTNKTFPTYYIAGAKLADDGGPFVIENGKIFLYLNES